jgi:replicative DNA helicase
LLNKKSEGVVMDQDKILDDYLESIDNVFNEPKQEKNKSNSTPQMPYSQTAEQGVLGSILLDGNSIIRVVDIISPDDFYGINHKNIYIAALKLFQSGDAIDIITLSDQLEKNGVLSDIGGIAYLSQLANSVVTSANIEHHAKIIKKKSQLKKLLYVTGDIASKIYDGAMDEDEIISHAEKAIFDVSSSTYKTDYKEIGSVIESVTTKINNLFHKKTIITGLQSGLDAIDEMTSGFQPGDLIILGGRPSMGKTALALNIAGFVGLSQQRNPVAIFSLEMSHEQLVMRMLCSEAEINIGDIKQGLIGRNDFMRLGKISKKLLLSPIAVDDSSTLTTTEIHSKSMKIKNEFGGLSLIIVDYLQLMHNAYHSRKRYENREREISEISRALKALAKDLNAPVIALSQLNRGVEGRTDKRPNLADLRESGAIEQDADLVMLLYRDEVYHKDKIDNKGKADIIIAKQRNGDTGTVVIGFNRKYVKFYNLSKNINGNYDDGWETTDDVF